MRNNPRLLFSEEVQAPPEQPNPIPKTKQPPNSTISTTTPKNENQTTQQRTVKADNGKKAVRLRFCSKNHPRGWLSRWRPRRDSNARPFA